MVQHLYTTGIVMGSIPELKEGKQILLEYNRKRSREIAQKLRESADYSLKGTRFSSQQLHGGSQPSKMRSDALFCGAGKYADRTLYTYLKNKSFLKRIQ